MWRDNTGRENTHFLSLRRAGKFLAVFLTLLTINVVPTSAAFSTVLGPIYEADLSGSYNPTLDVLGLGPVQPGFSDPNVNPTFITTNSGTYMSVTRPVGTIAVPSGVGLFVTPVSFAQGSVFAMQATFFAPTGPHGSTDQWAATLSARTGDQVDLAAFRTAASFQVRGNGARLNVVGATTPPNQANIPQAIYDAIFDPIDPQPFILYLLIDRQTGDGTATLTVGSYVTSVNFLMANFQANSGPTITAVGPTLAIANAPGQTASIFVRDFSIFSVPEPRSWMMMLAGFGLIGFALRRENKRMPSRVT